MFQKYMVHDIADLAAIAAETFSHQFQSVDCTQLWTDYLSKTLGPNIWGPGDAHVSLSTEDTLSPTPQPQRPQQSKNFNNAISTQRAMQPEPDSSRITTTTRRRLPTSVEKLQQTLGGNTKKALKDAEEAEENAKTTFSPKVLTGGTTTIQSFLQFLATSDCHSLRYALFAHGKVGTEGDRDSSVLSWMIMSGKCKAKVDALIKKYGSLQKVPFTDIRSEDIAVYKVNQREGDLLVLPPNAVCHAATLNGHVALVSWLRQVPKTLSMLYEKFVVPNYHDPSSANALSVPVRFSIARALDEVNK